MVSFLVKMLFLVILSLAASSGAQWPEPERASAASDAQIRFAIENKYDGTGPGAKEPEYAYRTYETLDEAILAYVNDPDTQLPEYEKNRALQSLQGPIYDEATPVTRYQPKTVDEYTGYNPPQQQHQNLFVPPPNIYPFAANDVSPKNPQSFKFQKYQTVKVNPISLTHYKKKPKSYYQSEPQADFDPNPQYTFSYGVHDKGTGDSKSAHETRDGGTVRGYYTFMDPDGKQRTVHYTADDKLGFRATVQRTQTNTQ